MMLRGTGSPAPGRKPGPFDPKSAAGDFEEAGVDFEPKAQPVGRPAMKRARERDLMAGLGGCVFFAPPGGFFRSVDHAAGKLLGPDNPLR